MRSWMKIKLASTGEISNGSFCSFFSELCLRGCPILHLRYRFCAAVQAYFESTTANAEIPVEPAAKTIPSPVSAESTEATAATTTSSAEISCQFCELRFSSRNKLFRHLNDVHNPATASAHLQSTAAADPQHTP
eukprot:m.240655 g.240655  ORF g.240655 m.240655 type:complete len:134 (-) comp54408_c0_seq8:112-513(-)